MSINPKSKAPSHPLRTVKHLGPVRWTGTWSVVVVVVLVVLTRARRLERELDDAEQRAEVVSTTLIRSRSMHRGDYD